MTDTNGNLLWYGEYTAWGRLKKDERVYKDAHQPFRLQNQYFDKETGLHYNLMRYYEPEAGRFVNQDPIGLDGGDNLYLFAFSSQSWIDPMGLKSWKQKALDNGSEIPLDENGEPCSNLHGHHIVFKGLYKGNNKRHKAMRKALSPGKKILQSYGIDVTNNANNLMIAPNNSDVHSVDNAKKVSKKLKKADKKIQRKIEKGKLDPSQKKCAMEKELQKIGKKVFGKYC